MNHNENIIQSLWIGSVLSPLELLTLKSFVHYGHLFHLYVYEDLVTSIPKEIIVKDANTIIPSDQIFRYKQDDPTSKQGKGSVAGFSDIFRYKLLYERGGWWVDMDVTCLKPFLFDSAYVFRTHDYLPIVGNIMKCPPKSLLMKLCYEEAIQTIDEENIEWLKPVLILNKHIDKLGLLEYRNSGIVNADRWELIALYYYFNYKINSKYIAIHWVSNAWKAKQLNKNYAIFNSTYENLLHKYNIEIETVKNTMHKLKWWEWFFRNTFIPLLPNFFRVFLKKYIL